MALAPRTHCRRGHLYTPETERWRMQSGRPNRGCKLCEAITSRLWYRNVGYKKKTKYGRGLGEPDRRFRVNRGEELYI